MIDQKCPLYEFCSGACHDCLMLPADDDMPLENVIEGAIWCWKDQIQESEGLHGN